MTDVKETVEGEEEWDGEAEVREGEKGFGVMLVERREGRSGCGRSCRSWAMAGQLGRGASCVRGGAPMHVVHWAVAWELRTRRRAGGV